MVMETNLAVVDFDAFSEGTKGGKGARATGGDRPTTCSSLESVGSLTITLTLTS